MVFRFFLFIFFCFFSTVSFADELIIEPDQGRQPILSALNDAKSSIYLVMYGMTDHSLLTALTHAKQCGKNVTILLEPHPYKSKNENQFAFRHFDENKINVLSPNPYFNFMHQKTLVIDNRYAFIMTFNFTHSTFKDERNFALRITNPAMIQEIVSVLKADAEHKIISVHQSDLIWSPNNSREKILNLIRSAQSHLFLYAPSLNDYETIGELAKAARRGIDVRILLSTSISHRDKGKIHYLKKSGVHVNQSQHYRIHAKVIMVDHKHAMLGSINFTKTSFDKNRELSVVTHDRHVIGELEKTFFKDYTAKT